MIKNVGLYDQNGDVVNVIVIDTDQAYTPQAGLFVIDDEMAAIGDTVVDGALVKPEPPAIEEIIEEGA